MSNIRASRIKYDRELFTNFFKDITLIGEYQNPITRETRIQGQCITENCLNTFNRSFRDLHESGRFLCKYCGDKRVHYDRELFTKVCKNFTLIGDYTGNINRETRVQGYCITDGCERTFDKSFRDLHETGCYLCKYCGDKRVHYDHELFTEVCKNFTLIGDYTENITRETRIQGYCTTDGCERTFERSFRDLHEIGGYCKYCNDKRVHNETPIIKNSNKVYYDRELFTEVCKNFTLIGDYTENINRETRIHGHCITDGCERTFDRSFRDLHESGCYLCKYCGDKRVHYDRELFTKVCKDINLIGNYTENINRETRIQGYCITDGCDKTFDRSFRDLHEIGGYCKYCVDKRGNDKKTRQQRQCITKDSNKIYYDRELFNGVCKDVNLIGDYTGNINRNTRIQGYCITDGCEKTFDRSFRYLYETGCYCKYCGDKRVHYDRELFTEICKNINLIGDYTENINRETRIQGHCTTKDCLNTFDKTFRDLYEIGCFNCSYCSQSIGMVKAQKNSFRTKDYVFPSNNAIKVQGFEPFGLDYLINIEKIDENQIITGIKNVPITEYFTEIDMIKTQHKHYVDIFIPHQNRMIEIKSTWTLIKKLNSVYLKQTAAEQLNYKYEIWVFNGKGGRFVIMDSSQQINFITIKDVNALINNTAEDNLDDEDFSDIETQEDDEIDSETND